MSLHLFADAADGAAVAAVVMWLVIAAGSFLAWLAPVVIAVWRGHPNTAAICVVDVLLGWTCIGWVVALAWSMTAFDRPMTRTTRPQRDSHYDDEYD